MRFHSALSKSALPLLTLLVGLSVAAAPAIAANVTSKPLPAVKSQQPKTSSTIDLMVDKSISLSLKAPAASIFIANPDIADIQVISPTFVMVYGKKEGQTTLQISDGSGHDLVSKTVVVTQNLADLREALRTMVPGSTIRVESIPNGIILSGDVTDASSIEDARRLAARYVGKDGDIINRVRVKANNQVQIRVRFAEVSRDVDKRLGINWENVANLGQFTLGLATGVDFVTAGSTNWTRTTVDGDVNHAINGSFNNNHFSVNGMIDALAKDGLVTILAEPSLSAMSGQTASFLAGGEFPIPVPQSGDTITIEWKQYGVSLAFTPTIIGDNRINLHVRPEVSQLSDTGSITLNNIVVPAITTRRAETTIELGSGQSFALAGLINSQQTQSVGKYPFLGDIPVLGALFRSSRFQNNETELVIIITPYVVKPTGPGQLSLPTDGFSPPSDADLFYKLRNTNSNASAATLSGEPAAVKVENPVAAEAPVPIAAPKAPVAKYQTVEQIAARPAPMSTPIPETVSAPVPKAKAQAPKPAPSGPGGFIVE